MKIHPGLARYEYDTALILGFPDRTLEISAPGGNDSLSAGIAWSDPGDHSSVWDLDWTASHNFRCVNFPLCVYKNGYSAALNFYLVNAAGADLVFCGYQPLTNITAGVTGTAAFALAKVGGVIPRGVRAALAVSYASARVILPAGLIFRRVL